MSPVNPGRFWSPFFRAVSYGCTFLLVLAPALSARAQAGGEQAYPAELPAQDAPAHISLVDGAATVERDGQSQPASANAPFVPGDRLRTTVGRVEVLLPDGSALDVDQYSAVDLQSPTLIRLVSGRLLLVVAGAANPVSAVRYQIDTPVASAQIDGAGEYRVAVLNGANGLETELAVLRGLASLVTERGSMAVRAGERSVARDAEAPSFPQAFNSARFDAFDRWAAARRDERTGAVSSAYLPQDLQMYDGTFDRYGSWQYTSPYGHVWYPTVAPDWRPYYHGYWAPYQQWGWTWIGVDAWSWPTHHFGRWGFARSRWFWVPGRTWSPAWVAWAGAPGFVSWCPLGLDGRPVFAFSLGFASRWGGWTVLPRHSFGPFARVDRFAVAPDHLAPSTQFVVQRTAPVAVPRTAHAQNVTIGGVGTGLAVPRPSAGTGLNPGPARLPGNSAVQSRIGTGNEMRAVPRTPVIAAPRTATAPAPPAVHEFKQALPGAVRSPAYAVPRQQAIPASPTAAEPAPYAGRRNGYSVVAPRGEAPRVYQPPPAYTPRSETPGPQAVPRWTSPTNVAPPPRTYQPPPARVDHPSAPPSAPVNRPYAPPPPRVDHPSTPPAQMMAVPRSAPAPAAPRSGGSPPPPPPPHSGGSGGSGGPGGSSHTSHGGSSGRSSSGEAHRR